MLIEYACDAEVECMKTYAVIFLVGKLKNGKETGKCHFSDSE